MAKIELDLGMSGNKCPNILFMSASLSQTTYSIRVGTWLLAAS